jgi:autotransporter-associated beta strand protein
MTRAPTSPWGDARVATRRTCFARTITIGDGVGSANTANLAILADNQMPDSTDLVLNADGRLQMGTSEDAVSQISGTGQIDLGASGKLIIGDDNSNSTFGGSITSDDINGTLVKNGSGILELTSDISYDGTLELGGGTLKLSDIDLTVGALHITADTTIDFSGSSTFSVGDFTFANPNIVVTILNWDRTVDFFYATNWVGAKQDVLDNEFSKPESQVVFGGWQGNNTGWNSYDDQISPNVPEPSTYGMIFMAACSALYVAKRFRNKRSATIPRTYS